MGQVLIRNVDDKVIAGLKLRAKLGGESLESFLRGQLSALAPLSGEERMTPLDEFHRDHGSPAIVTAPEDVVRVERERR